MTTELLERTAGQLDDAEYDAAIERLRAYQAQLDQADKYADAGSLQRAMDLAAIYADKRWMADLPEPKQSRKPGAFQTVPDSRNRFATKWVKEKIGLTTRYATGLLQANDLVESIGSVEPTVGAFALRPMAKLLSQGRSHEAADVWRRALKLAEGKTPTADHVRRALAEHNKMMGYTPAKQTEMRSQTLRETYRSRVKRDFEWLVSHSSPDEVKALLRELAERVAAEKQWARGEA